ncbi:hypothetical protein HZS_7350, partial [Henneguya salminicola]
MGLLSTGTSLTWEEIEKWSEYVKEHGILQFINIYNSLKGRENDLLKYGDEVEYCMIYLDHINKCAKLDLRACEALEILQENELNNQKYLDSLWRMEYSSYMIEGTPGKPFCCTISRLKLIETSMWLRKQELDEVLNKIDSNLIFVCYSAFPRVGCSNFTNPEIDLSLTDNSISKSTYFPDSAIFLDHPRFANLTRNIRSRLGHKQKIYVPVWFDINTPNPFLESIPTHADLQTRQAIIPNHIYMDCMGFGMGCSCLQITVQAGDVMEARNLYDQLAVIAPILMTLTACSPAWKGILSDWDCRWKVISMACDDRLEKERIGDKTPKIRKSRYDTIDMYLHPKNSEYNDVDLNFSADHYNSLISAGVDDILAKHIAHLFCRDPISLFEEKLKIDDKTEIDHFENFQSTNWQSCRFKPPPLNSTIGWRVEFRTLEVQFTCYENSLFVIFIILLSRAIIKSSLNFIVPISIMEHNMDRAVIRDAVNRSKFYFRKNVKNNDKLRTNETPDSPFIEELSIAEIFNGKKNKFIGLIPIINEYVSNLDIDIDTHNCINEALRFIEDRASVTPAHIEAYKKMVRIESMTNTEKKLGLLERKGYKKGEERRQEHSISENRLKIVTT